MVGNLPAFGDATSLAVLHESVVAKTRLKNAVVDEPSTPRPTLSVVIRTQGRRPTELREALLCLAAQTVDDFEVIVVGHDLDTLAVELVRALIDDTVPSLRSRISFISANGGTRARPLNVGFDQARGAYVSAFDDDDLVFAHWAATFVEIASAAGGRVIRARCVWQEAEIATIHGTVATTAVNAAGLPYDEAFSIVRHIWSNETPFMSVAFPRSLHAAGIVRFDEQLSTLEDWDYLLQVTSLTGVVDSDEVTSLYRRWVNAPNAVATHDEQEWVDNLGRLEEKLDARTIVLPAGETSVIRALLSQSVLGDGGESRRRVPTEALREEALSLVRSRSWRWTHPFRRAARLVGRGRAVDERTIVLADRTRLIEIIGAIRSSRSWYLARVFKPTADQL